MNISIDELGGGGLLELINREFQKLSENVLDPNTNATAARSINIAIKVVPDESRQMAKTDYSVKSTLAPVKGLQGNFVFDFGADGKATLRELNLSKDRNQSALADNGDVVDGSGAPLRVVGGSPYR